VPLPWTVEDRIEMALTRHRNGFHCSQSVLAAYADDLGIPVDLALRMAAALAGGSTVGGECGAVAAGYLILGARHGLAMPTGGDVGRDGALFGRLRRFAEQFKDCHGSLNCRELLGVDVFTREGLAEGRRRGLFVDRCRRYIRDAIAILESLG
jgi:C_GCAxxG_C_C family probable redox protein